MATEPQYIDLDDDDDSDLARLADEVRVTNAPRLLRRGGVVIATITPRNPRSSNEAKTAARYDREGAGAGVPVIIRRVARA